MSPALPSTGLEHRPEGGDKYSLSVSSSNCEGCQELRRRIRGMCTPILPWQAALGKFKLCFPWQRWFPSCLREHGFSRNLSPLLLSQLKLVLQALWKYPHHQGCCYFPEGLHVAGSSLRKVHQAGECPAFHCKDFLSPCGGPCHTCTGLT